MGANLEERAAYAKPSKLQAARNILRTAYAGVAAVPLGIIDYLSDMTIAVDMYQRVVSTRKPEQVFGTAENFHPQPFIAWPTLSGSIAQAYRELKH